MPRGDRTGPPGGAGAGGGTGRGGGAGRMGGNRPGVGPGGVCICPECGATASHGAGVPCYDLACPKCGAKMVRE